LPGACDALGGTLLTLSLLIKRLKIIGATESLCVHSGSLMEKYLIAAGQFCLQLIRQTTKAQFLKKSIAMGGSNQRVILIGTDNCDLNDHLLPVIALACTPALRIGRVYHFLSRLGTHGCRRA